MEQIDLTEFIITKQEAVDFSDRISAIQERVYEVDFNLENILKEQFDLSNKEKFLSLLRKNNISTESSSALNGFLVKLREYVSSLPTALLTIAVEPDDSMLKEISDWFMLNTKQQVVLEILIDVGIIAGANISYQGKQSKLSIRPIFEDVCSTILKRYPVKVTVPIPQEVNKP